MRRAFLAALVVLGAHAPAHAQSFHVLGARAVMAGAPVATLVRADVEITRWEGPRAPRARFEDETVELDLLLDLGASGVHLVAGVGASTTLAAANDWTVVMLAESWAPLAGAHDGAVEVVLPPRMPVRRARIPAGAAPATGRPAGAPWTHERVNGREWSLACERTIEVHARPRPNAATAVVRDPQWIRLGPRDARGWAPVEIFDAGFVLHAWTRRRLRTCDGGIASGRGSASCGAVSSPVPRRTLLAGTTLHAGGPEGEPFARLRREAIAQVVEPHGALRLHGGRRDGAEWWIEGWPSPRESAIDADPVVEPASLPCFAPPLDWPSRELARRAR